MKNFLVIVLLLVLGACGYGYVQNPDAFAKFTSNLKAGLVGMLLSTPATSKPDDIVVAGTSVSTPAPETPEWTPPTVMPVEANWTWPTPDKIYKDVKVIQIEADQVTIKYAEGSAVVQTWTLPDDIRRRLNYNPKAAVAASARRPKIVEAPAPVVAAPVPQIPQTPYETTDYAEALAASKASGKHVLLHFTGSDWCPYCKVLDQEVLSTHQFHQFAAQNYITVTLDFPHDFPLIESLKQQNTELARKYNVTGYPTLIVIDSSEKVLGRSSGYTPGSGPDAIIDELKSYGK